MARYTYTVVVEVDAPSEFEADLDIKRAMGDAKYKGNIADWYVDDALESEEEES